MKIMFNIKYCMFLLAIACIFNSSCAPEKSNDEVVKKVLLYHSLISRPYSLGVVPLPENWTSEKIAEAYSVASETGDVVSLSQKLGWNSNDKVEDYQNDVNLARSNNLKVFVSIDVLTDDRTGIGNLPAGWESRNFSDNELRTAFIDEAKAVASTYSPDYLMLGIEINGYKLSEAADYSNFVTLYNETYDEIKSISQEIKVGITFQYETIITNVQWDIISGYVGKADMICFTTYPIIAGYSNLLDLPENYYTPLKNYESTADIVFSEVGWTGGDTVSTESEQAEFIDKFFELTDDIDKIIIIWSLLHDWPGGGVFEKMGLIDNTGRKKSSYIKWLEYVN